jgi:uncharacterized repeat protein (TIGR01451 family)
LYVSDFTNNAVRILEPVGTEPLLGIASSHTGVFNVGQANATYTLTVSNAALAATSSGTVTVTETLPAGLSLVSMAGTGWNCSANVCTNSGTLAGGASYQPISVVASVGLAAQPQVTNLATVSGGGSPGASAADATFIGPANPLLTISKTHAGNFGLGQNAAYTLTVGNQASAPATSGTVTVTDTLPTGLSLVSMAGAGWNCTATTCTRGDALGSGASYSAITVTVSVASHASSPVTNQAAVAGGGSTGASASDVTILVAADACDINGDGVVNVADVQLEINEALGIAPAANDVNHDGVVNVADVQIVINAALGLGCPY